LRDDEAKPAGADGSRFAASPSDKLRIKSGHRQDYKPKGSKALWAFLLRKILFDTD